MTEVVLDANVIVALLYAADAQHVRACQLVDRLEASGRTPVFVDFLVFEALSVLCRRATERKTAAPDLNIALQTIRVWFDNSEIRFLAGEAQRLGSAILDVVAETQGRVDGHQDPQKFGPSGGRSPEGRLRWKADDPAPPLGCAGS